MASVVGSIYPPGRRTQVSVAYSHIVIEHQSAITQLLGSQHHASAFALARPAYEALVKGLWLYHCANDEQVEKHALGKELKDLGLRIKCLQKSDLPKVILHSLEQIQVRYWGTLSSLAHVGHSQLRNWLIPTGVQASYPQAAIEELANFANFMAVVAGRELAARSGNQQQVSSLTSMLPSMDAI